MAARGGSLCLLSGQKTLKSFKLPTLHAETLKYARQWLPGARGRDQTLSSHSLILYDNNFPLK